MIRPARAFAATALVASAFATPLGGRAVGRACAADTVHIAVVVDPGSGPSVSAVCVPAGARDNGATILAERAARLGTPPPRYNAAGLLCAIDGVPQTGCGEKTDARYAYWAYFHGSGGTWSYSSFGPGSWRVDPGTVEGWRFQLAGKGLPTDAPPRGPASAAAICAPQPTPTTVRPTISRTTVPHSGGTPSVIAPAATTPLIGPEAAGTGPAVATATSTTASTSNTAARPTTATTARGHPSTTVAGATSASPSSSIVLTTRGLAAPPGAHSSGGAPLGVIIGAVLLIALGTGGAVAARRRRPAS